MYPTTEVYSVVYPTTVVYIVVYFTSVVYSVVYPPTYSKFLGLLLWFIKSSEARQ